VVSNFLKPPGSAKTLQEIKAEGALHDVSSSFTRDFVFIQGQLLSYRVMRLVDEGCHLWRHPREGIPDFMQLVVDIMCIVGLFLLFQWFGQSCIWTLDMPPTS
jgi:hypothetical protein